MTLSLNKNGLFSFRLLLLICLFLSGREPFALAAPPAHGLDKAIVQKLKQLKYQAVVPGSLPQGFRFKALTFPPAQKGLAASYRLEYRCFCGGMNYGFAIMGNAQALNVMQAKRPERLETLKMGTIEYLFYDPHAPLGLREKFFLTRPFGKGPVSFQVLSNFEGAAMRKEQWLEVLKHLTLLAS
jgi:hypothetical protein